MQFIEKQDFKNWAYREESTDGKIVIGIYPVIFGFRIRAGYTKFEDSWFELDYCAGAEQDNVEKLFSQVKTIFLRHTSDEIFTTVKWPNQDKKPYFLDLTNYPKFMELVGEYVQQDLPSMAIARAKYMNANFGVDEPFDFLK
jgi:hypothetical protein